MKSLDPQRLAQRNRDSAGVWRIESETLTVAEIARRLGITEAAARRRLSKLRMASGAVTWVRLRAFGVQEEAA
jgi:predicted ArsR family transcriptional regulator